MAMQPHDYQQSGVEHVQLCPSKYVRPLDDFGALVATSLIRNAINQARHGIATGVDVELLATRQGRIRLTVHDDGLGFAPRTPGQQQPPLQHCLTTLGVTATGPLDLCVINALSEELLITSVGPAGRQKIRCVDGHLIEPWSTHATRDPHGTTVSVLLSGRRAPLTLTRGLCEQICADENHEDLVELHFS